VSKDKDQTPSGASKVRQVEAIANGTVIDHIPGAMTLKVAALLSGREDQVFIGMNLRSARLNKKGVVKISGRELSERSVECPAPRGAGSQRVFERFSVVDESLSCEELRTRDRGRTRKRGGSTHKDQMGNATTVRSRGKLRVAAQAALGDSRNGEDSLAAVPPSPNLLKRIASI